MWELRFDSPLDEWAVVPTPDESERRSEWSAVVGAAVRKYWQVDEGERFAEELDQVLESLLRSRPQGALADFVAWPTLSALPLRVTFLLADIDDSVDWSSSGFEASPYLQGPFGEGSQYSRRTPPELAGGTDSVDSLIVFDRGGQALIVVVHPCPLDVYIMSAAAIAKLIESCVLKDSAGQLFTTGKSEYWDLSEPNVWPEEGTVVRA